MLHYIGKGCTNENPEIRMKIGDVVRIIEAQIVKDGRYTTASPHTYSQSIN